jgi:hypothetical protein
MSKTPKNPQSEVEVDVLYQKLGERWYAFSIVNDEVFMSPVSDDQIHSARTETTNPQNPQNFDDVPVWNKNI